MTFSSSCRFSIALDSCVPSSSARSSRSSSPPVSTRTPSKTTVPSARRRPRSGTVTVLTGASRGPSWISARVLRSATAAGASASSTFTCRPGRHRRADRTRPRASDVATADCAATPWCGRRRTAGSRAGRRASSPVSQIERRREAGRHFVEQLSQLALKFLVPPEAEQLERRQHTIRDVRRPRSQSVGSLSPALKPTASRPTRWVPLRERYEQRGRHVQPAGQVRHLLA